MRLYIISTVLCLCACGAQAAGHAEWLRTTHNFGAFHEDDGVRTCSMQYVNTGDAPLSITAARSSCGCTLAKYSRAPLAPGDTAEIVVSYDPTGRPGRFSKNVYINFDNDEGRRTLTVSGVVISGGATLSQRYPVEAGEHLHMSRGAVMAGDVAKGRMKTVFLEIYNAGTDTLRPSVASVPAFADVAFLPPAIAPGEQSSLVCHVHTERCDSWGLVEDSIVIMPSPAEDAVTIPVTAVISEDFSRLTDEDRVKAPVVRLEPERLDFGVLDRSSAPVTLRAEVYNDGHNTLEIRRVYTIDPGITVKADRTSIKRGRKTEVSVTVDPSLISGSILNAKIVIISNDPTRPNMSLRAVGTIAGRS